MAETLKIAGLKELEADLKDLPAQVRTKIMLPAMKKGLRIMADDAISKAPQGSPKRFSRWSPKKKYFFAHNPGALKRSIKIADITDEVTALKSAVFCDTKGKRRDSAFYAHMVEFGHPIIITAGPRRQQVKIGFAPPRPFMRPAAAENWEKVVGIFVEETKKKIGTFFRRSRKGVG